MPKGDFQGRLAEEEVAGPSSAPPIDEARPSTQAGPSSMPSSLQPKRKRGKRINDGLTRVIKFCKNISKDLNALHQKVDQANAKISKVELKVENLEKYFGLIKESILIVKVEEKDDLPTSVPGPATKTPHIPDPLATSSSPAPEPSSAPSAATATAPAPNFEAEGIVIEDLLD